MAEPPVILRVLARFGLAGLLTTAVGFGVIAGLDVGLHVSPPVANAGGYLVGVPLGFALNRRFVFAHSGPASHTLFKYIAVIIAAWLLNQLVLRGAGMVLGRSTLGHLAAQLAGMGTYTVATFIACRLWVFREPAAA